ncbi:MAG: polyprenyl synthetase family protein [Actinomycetota bacterium]|nr:polyprenyl synthetase family protein [Actinomycetota bacterium]
MTAGASGILELPPACVDLAGRVDRELERFVAAQRAALDRVDARVDPLLAEIQRVIEAGGKRLRPLFCCLGHMAAGAEVGEEAIRAASALELLHTFAIVHDDVMDRSASRRGVPATWVHLAEEHRSERFVGDSGAYGIAAAVLAGDMSLVLADRALLEAGFPIERLVPALSRYDRMRVEVVAGQYLDVRAAHRGSADEAEARRIAVLKSGGYTVEAPLEIGAILGAAADPIRGALSGYGVRLGEAFQLRDDVLGTFGDPAVTGKDRDSDLREGKRTVMLAKAAAAADHAGRAFLRDRVGRPDLTDAEIERARSLIAETGALDDVVALIRQLVDEAKAEIAGSEIPSEAARLLDEMAEVVAVRRL